MFNKIVVPLDGSDIARRALPPALALARKYRAELVLVRVPELAYMIVPGDAGHALLYPEQSLEYSEKQAREYLERVRETLAAPDLTITAETPRGEAAAAIVEAAVEAEADLIVMSSHGYSGFTRWLLGSVAEKALHSAPCPVLVVRSPEPLRSMLIPLDGSALAEQALEPALAVAAGLELPVTLLRAVPTLDRSEVERLNQFESGFGWRVERDLAEEGAEYLAQLVQKHGRPGLAIETAVRYEPAAESILDFAEARNADVIAMATHGRTGLRRWVYGSVTEKVLRGARHSMLVVRPPALALSESEVGPAAEHLPKTLTAMPPHPVP